MKLVQPLWIHNTNVIHVPVWICWILLLHEKGSSSIQCLYIECNIQLCQSHLNLLMSNSGNHILIYWRQALPITSKSTDVKLYQSHLNLLMSNSDNHIKIYWCQTLSITSNSTDVKLWQSHLNLLMLTLPITSKSTDVKLCQSHKNLLISNSANHV